MPRIWLVLLLLLTACAGRSSKNVVALSLHDPRVPIEARRTLADAEDEVSIARARVDAAEEKLIAQRAYGRSLVLRAETLAQGGAAEAVPLPKLFEALSDARTKQQQRAVDAAEATLRLARARLKLSRAETAVRHDLAVYDIYPLELEVETSRDKVAAAEQAVEAQRAETESTADAAWTALGLFLAGGGTTDALWAAPE